MSSVPGGSPDDRHDPRVRVLDNVRWGITWGLRLALLFSAWVAVLMLLSGSFVIRASDNRPANGLLVIALYFAGAVVSGTIVGLTRRLARWTIGAILVGFLAALPVMAGAIMMARGRISWDTENTVLTLAAAALLGPATAVAIRADAEEEQRPPSHRR